MLHYTVTSANSESSNGKRRGSTGVVESMMLLKLRDYMHAPFTQVHLTHFISYDITRNISQACTPPKPDSSDKEQKRKPVTASLLKDVTA